MGPANMQVAKFHVASGPGVPAMADNTSPKANDQDDHPRQHSTLTHYTRGRRDQPPICGWQEEIVRDFDRQTVQMVAPMPQKATGGRHDRRSKPKCARHNMWEHVCDDEHIAGEGIPLQ